MRKLTGPPPGVRLGQITFEVFYDTKTDEFVANTVMTGSEEITQMEQLLSKDEAAFAERIKLEAIKDVLGLFSFMRNPDVLKKALPK